MAVICTAGEAVVRALAGHGVDTVLGIPGTHNLGIYAHLGRHGIAHVTPRHEQGGGYAADAYARVSGRPGVLLTTTGPGALNAAAAFAQAWSDSSPVLLIAPGMPTTHVGGAATGFLHESRDQFAAMAALSDDARRVTTPSAAAEAVRDAFAAFTTGRPRPRYLELPLDVIDAEGEVDEEVFTPWAPRRPTASQADIARAAAVLLEGARVGIVAGGGARSAGDAVRRVAERLGAGVVTSTNGRGVLPESHPLALGAALHLEPVQEWLRGRDVVLVVGSELAESDAWTTAPLVTGRVVRVDLDPVQAEVNAPPAEVFLHGDAAETVAALADALGGPSSDGAAASLVGVRAARAAAAEGLAARWAPMLAGLRESMPPDTVLATDNSMACYRGALVGMGVDRPSSYLFPTGFGTLGFAVPAAVGAALGAPRRPVVALTGDGGLQFTVNELATLVDVCRDQGRGVPVVVVVNGGYGEIRQQQLDRGDAPLGVDLTAPDWAALAVAYGARAVVVRAASGDAACRVEVRDAVRTGFGHPVPTVVVVTETTDLRGEDPV